MACKIIYKGISYDESDFKSQIERYIAINNLFNENETLANEVYEALGFEQGINNTTERNNKLNKIKPDGKTRKDRKKIIALNRTSNKTKEDILREAGYIDVDGIFIDPDADMEVIKKIPSEIWQIMKDNGIIVLSFTNEGNHHAMAGTITLNGIKYGEIQFTKNGLDFIEHNILHEIGHIVWQNLTDKQREQLSSYKEGVTPYVKSEERNQQSGASNAEENFAESFSIDMQERLYGKNHNKGHKGKYQIEEQYKQLFNDINKIENRSNDSSQITPEQKQKAQQLYSSYLQTTNNPNIEGFKQWNNRQQQINELFETNLELANQIYEALGFDFRYTIEAWKDDPTKKNAATYIHLKGTPSDQEFQVKKDSEEGFYSVHFKTEQGKLTKEQIQILVDAIASQIPIGGKLSTHGEITKGGISGLNRFLNNGFKKVGEREIKDRKGKPIIIPILEKVSKSNLEQQAQQVYSSQYLEQNPNGNMKGFKEFVNNKSSQVENIEAQAVNWNYKKAGKNLAIGDVVEVVYSESTKPEYPYFLNFMVDGVPNINNEEKSLKLALKGLTPEEKISFCNHFGITMTEENGKKC